MVNNINVIEKIDELNVKRAAQKEEALQRLIKIGVDEMVIKPFKEGQIMYSERQNAMFNAVLYNVPADLQAQIEAFEEEFGSYVYHVQITHTEFGKMYSLLYVSELQEEWPDDHELLKTSATYAYVICGDVKEIGLICVKSSMGGIVRTY